MSVAEIGGLVILGIVVLILAIRYGFLEVIIDIIAAILSGGDDDSNGGGFGGGSFGGGGSNGDF